MGGAVALAVLVSLADSRTATLRGSGDSLAAALNGGYRVAFIVGAAFLAVSIAIGAALLRTPREAPEEHAAAAEAA